VNSVWILVPCFFDSLSFIELRKRIALVERALEQDFVFKTVVVDDSAGNDESLYNLPTEPYTVLIPEHHLGHQGALVFGLHSLSNVIAETAFVITMDCDGEDRPEDIPVLLRQLQNRSHDLSNVCVAERRRRHGTLMFRICVIVFQLAYQLLTGVRIRHGNFVAFRGKFVKQILCNQCFEWCYSSSIASVATDHQSVLLDRGRRYAGESKMSFVRLMGHGVAMAMPFYRQLAVRSTIFATTALTILFTLAAVLQLRIDYDQFIQLAIALSLMLLAFLSILVSYVRTLQTRASTLSDVTRRLGVGN